MPKENKNPTPLEASRRASGLTRKALAEKSGVPLRTIEAYEQRKNDINLAAADTVRHLAKVLKVPMENILN